MKNKSVLYYLIRKVRHRIPALLLMTLAHVGSAVFGVWFALGTRGVVNSAVSGSREAFLDACLKQAGIILGILLCLTVYRWLHDRLAADLDRDWKRQLLAGLLRAEYAGVSAYHSGELLNRMNNDVRAVNDGLLATLPGAAAMVTRLAAVMAVLFALEPLFALLLLALGVAVILVTGLARRKLRNLHKAVSAAEGRVSGFLQETLEKLMIVQAMNVEDEVEHRADAHLSERYDLQRKRRRVSLVANSFVSVFSYGSGFVALVWCAFSVLQGTMSFGDLTAITQLVSQLQGPLVNLSGFFPKYIAMTAATERLMELEALFSEEDMEAVSDTASLYEEMTALQVEALCFSYDRDVVLQPSSFCLPKDSFAVVVGPSGIGKSTLLKLLLGIFHPTAGKLLAETAHGAVPIDRSTRGLFAFVPQGNLLFSGTLKENLLLTHPKATEEEIREAVYVSGMDAYLPLLPNGLETQLGENAHGLSEGQAQRLAIARAVLSGSPILLLDEVTSALDEETERLVLQRLKALPNRTCIAVTHRSAALELADWLLKVDNGKIVCMSTAEAADNER